MSRTTLSALAVPGTVDLACGLANLTIHANFGNSSSTQSPTALRCSGFKACCIVSVNVFRIEMTRFAAGCYFLSPIREKWDGR
jgi:hypothetical protein